jgi:hypothetical protein
MAVTLVKEDGTGRGNANTYVDVADGDAYFQGHLYASPWTTSSADSKAAALVMATRVIDAEFQFNGTRTKEDQALQWPRSDCRDPDRGDANWGIRSAGYVEPDVVPAAVIRATCEMARELLIVDRTAAPPGEGIAATQTSQASSGVDSGTSSMSSTTYSKVDTRKIISPVARAMLSKFGALVSGGGGSVRLVRA